MDLRKQQFVFRLLAAGLLGLAAVVGWPGCKKGETTGDTSAPGPEPPKCDNGEEYGGGKPNPCGRDLGEECAAGAECKTGHCPDGRCCDEACDAVCSFCEGFCARAPEGEDPRAQCAPAPVAGCEVGGFCDGLGACAHYAITEAAGELYVKDGVPSPTKAHVFDMAARSGRVALVAGTLDLDCEGGRRTLTIFDQTAAGWGESARFVFTEPKGQCFGRGTPSVALAGDLVVVGSTNGQKLEGKVVMYEAVGGGWIPTLPDVATESKAPGASVATDGDWVFAGDPNQGKGVVHAYRKVGGVWALEAPILSPAETYGEFGASLSFDGQRLLVGARTAKRAYVFELSGGAWTKTAELAPSEADPWAFGGSVHLSGATALVVGQRPGAVAAWVDVFTRISGVWVQTGTLRPFSDVPGIEDGTYERFGDHLALQGDTLLVGGDTQVFFYHRSGDTFAPLSKTPRWKGYEHSMPVAFAGDLAFARGQWIASPCSAP